MKKLAAIAVFVSSAVIAAEAQDTGACDRACLEGIADQYLAAMVAHDAAKAPLAEGFIFTENTAKLPPTEGLWFTASGLGDFKFYVADVHTGQVVWTGVAREHAKPVLLSVRLKVVNRRITEAESIVVRDVNEERNLATLKSPPPGFDEILPPEERMPRADMLRVVEIYFAALDTLDASQIPWDDDAYRVENGIATCGKIPGMVPPAAGLPASRACKSPDGKVPYALKTVHNVRPRRTPVIDEEKGITWGLYVFNHRGIDKIPLPDGTVVESYFKSPNSMPWADMFKTRNRKLRGIFAFGISVPYGVEDGWGGRLFE
ncbi:MAG: hypothetical protein EPO31_13115 [Gammaproteobacteria bacterium]|nr:MAG: hypothetical protein EPO31_13115 [Gammaproteobacteria bacterium]